MVRRIDTLHLTPYLTGQYSILVPNQRIRESLLQAIAGQRPDSCWLTPQINAIDIWIRNQWLLLSNRGLAPFAPLRLLDSVEESCIWLNLIEQDLSNNPLLSTGEAADSAQQAYQLFRLWLDDGSVSARLPPGSGIPELNRFRTWSAQFHSYCQAHSLISLADATRTLIDAWNEGSIAIPQRLVMLNFYQPPPLYSRLFELLSRQQDNVVVQTAGDRPASSGVLHRFPDFESECLACADWVKTLIEMNPASHIGIVFSGDELHRRQLQRWLLDVLDPQSLVTLTRQQQVFNCSASPVPLIEDGLVDEALLLLSLDDTPLPSAEFCRLLHSPNLAGSVTEREQRLLLHAHLGRNLGTSCSLSQLLRLMSRQEQPHHCPVLASALIRLGTLLRATHGPRSARDWAGLFQQQLDLLGWPTGDTQSPGPSPEALRAWQQTLSRFAALDPVLGAPMDRSTALARLRTLCQKTAVNAGFAPYRPLSLLDLHDAVGLDFDHLWLLDCSDQRQPAPPRPSPFLPQAAQRSAGIPGSHGEVQLARAREAFSILCRSTAGQLRASFHERDGDETYRPSSLLQEFAEEPVAVVHRQPLNRLALARSNQVHLTLLDTDPATPLLPDEPLSGGQAIVSDQSSCPFRAFATHRLGARPLEPFSNGLSPSARGTAVHIALETFFKRVTGQRQLLELSTTDRHALVHRGAEQALDYLARRYPELMTPRFSAIERQRLTTLIDGFLELEKQRDEYTVEATERSLSWQQDALQINLKIDRIDRMADGSLAVIDYKTGKTLPRLAQLLDARPENLQLPLYQIAVEEHQREPVAAVAFAQLNSEKSGYSGLAASGGFHPSIRPVSERKEFNQDWDSLSADWRDRIRLFAREFCDGEAAVSPVNGEATCTYCHLQGLCRIRELQPAPTTIDWQDEEPPQ